MQPSQTDPTPEPRNIAPAAPAESRRIGLVAGAVLIGLAIGFAGIYGIGTLRRNAPLDAACTATAKTVQRLAPLNRGEIAALALASQPKRLPDLTFHGPDGAARRLGDYRGRTILLNLWATWCVPCRKEMPALDALQAKLGGPGFEVVAVNIDTRDVGRAKKFYEEIAIRHLAFYSDHKAAIFQDLKTIGKAFGMPTSLLIDAKGCEIGTLAGPAEWASEDAIRLIEMAIKQNEAKP